MKKISLLLAVFGLCVGGSALANQTTKDVSKHAVGERSVFSQRATIERIKPIGEVCVEGKPCAAATAVAAPAAAAGGAGRSGEQVFNQVCAGCHGTGVMGAPKAGDKGAWGPRISKGVDTLHKHALGGFNAMPPKGTCAACTDAEVIGAVDYMVSKSK